MIVISIPAALVMIIILIMEINIILFLMLLDYIIVLAAFIGLNTMLLLLMVMYRFLRSKCADWLLLSMREIIRLSVGWTSPSAWY